MHNWKQLNLPITNLDLKIIEALIIKNARIMNFEFRLTTSWTCKVATYNYM